LTTSLYTLQEIDGPVLGGDEPATAVAEEEAAPPTEESAPAPQAESEVPAAEATLLEASVIEGEYSLRYEWLRRVVVAARYD
jgi:hypothetical protein